MTARHEHHEHRAPHKVLPAREEKPLLNGSQLTPAVPCGRYIVSILHVAVPCGMAASGIPSGQGGACFALARSIALGHVGCVILAACGHHAAVPDATRDTMPADAAPRPLPVLRSTAERCKLLSARNTSDPTVNDVQHRSNVPGDFEVPSGAFEHAGQIYVLYTTVRSPSDITMIGGYLARWSPSSFPGYDILYAIGDADFINIAAETTTDYVYLFGTGTYRA